MRLATIILCAMCSVGCAYVKHTRVPNRTADAKARGIRYYDGSPYLLVQPDGTGGEDWQVLYLPDRSKLMSAAPVNVMSKVDTTFHFEHGLLTKSEEIADASAFPNAVIGVVEKLAPIFLAEEPIEDEIALTEPRIYKIVIGRGSVEFRGKSADNSRSYRLN